MSFPGCLLSMRNASSLVRLSAGQMTCHPPTTMSMMQHRMKHTVRVICVEDLPNGQAYKGEVVHVKAGYARNHLIPRKVVLYATQQNFERLHMKDPDFETPEEKAARLEKEALQKDGGEDSKATDLLRHYLRNKVLKIWRKADPQTLETKPGLVNAVNVREKLSKQLRIDLDRHEKVHLNNEELDPAENTDDQIQKFIEDIDVEKPCEVEIRKLGQYVARITLRGGFVVPLKFAVLKAPHK